MEWFGSCQFGRLAVGVSASLLALAVFNLVFNTSRVFSWLPLLVIMPLALVYGIRCMRSVESGGGMLSWPDPELVDGERVVLQSRANWSKSGIPRGGTLVLTDRRLIFEPNSMEASIGLVSSEWPASSITGIGVAPRGPNLLAGALRRRLQVRFADGEAARFVVGAVDEFAGRMADQLA